MRDLHIRRPISSFPGSYALLSTAEKVTTAIFFVHGFMGNSEDTFWAFQYFCDAEGANDWWQDVDLYFFAYKSVADLLSTSTESWSKFLDQFFPSPPTDLFEVQAVEAPFPINENSILIRNVDCKYENAILVAHSEGAVVVRSELVNRSRDAYDRKTDKALDADPVLKGLLRLFAPAHLGACPTGVFGLIFNTPILKTAANMFLDWSKAATELRKSKMIEQLQQDTEALAERTHLAAYHADVVFGDGENVVSVGKFLSDRKENNLLGHSHTSVCKPRFDFEFPLSFVSQSRGKAHGT